MVYTFSNKIFKDIRPINLQRIPQDAKVKKASNQRGNVYEYGVTVFAFPSIVGQEDIELLRSKGFAPWLGSSTLYRYEIDLEEEKQKIVSIHMESTKEQRNFAKKNWDGFIASEMEKHGDFRLAKANYKKLESDAIPNINFYSVNDYLKFAKTNKLNMSDYFKYNARHGRKEQYASYIPHLAIVVSQPLDYKNIFRMKFK